MISSDGTATRDPVCGMTLTASSARATIELNGRTTYFCSQHCADVFALDPHRYHRAQHRSTPHRHRWESENP